MLQLLEDTDNISPDEEIEDDDNVVFLPTPAKRILSPFVASHDSVSSKG